MRNNIDYGWSTCFGLGKLQAPGTWGSLVGAGFYCVFQFLPIFLHWVLWIMVAAYSIVSASRIAHELNLTDPQEIISDEVVGMWLALLLITPGQIASAVFAFILFRVFDISKPGLVKDAEKLSGGLGIVMDDVVAAVFTTLVVLALRLVG